MNSKNSLIASENLTLNATVPARKKIRRRRGLLCDVNVIDICLPVTTQFNSDTISNFVLLLS